MTDSMVERVARALFAKEWKVESGWTFEQEMAQDPTGGLRQYWLDSARAAIAAMRDPTEPMMKASEQEWDGRLSYRCTKAWHAAIDAALSPETT